MQFMMRFLAIIIASISLNSYGATYRKATEGRDVVKNKIYPKERKLEINAPNLGLIMNQSYVNTVLISGGINYFFSESWGLGVDISIGSNEDKSERFCIENFYFDPSNEIGAACGDPNLLAADGVDQDGDTFPRMGPAYVPIREINNVLMANLIWTPVYGKQLVFLNSTSYFDLFVEFGAGFASSTFYRKRDVLENGNTPRGEFIVSDTGNDAADAAADASNDQIGARVDVPSDFNSYGIAGRPDARSETHLLFNLGVGQKFHFGGRFHFKVYIRNMTLLGTTQGFDNLLAIMGGMGMRL